MYVFIGASISSRDTEEAKRIAERIRALCSILDKHGHTYDADVLTDETINADNKEADFVIPEKYLKKATTPIVSRVSALRVDNPPYSLQDEVACYFWSLDLLGQAGACIWDLTKSSSGSGYEIAAALQMGKPSLVLYDRPTVSSMLNGCANPLLMVKHWGHDLPGTI